MILRRVCYKETGYFIAHVKYEDIYADLDEIDKIFSTTNYDVKRQLLIREYKKRNDTNER